MADSRRPQRQVRVAEGIYRRGGKNGPLYVAVWRPDKGKRGGKEWYSGAVHGFTTIPQAKAFKRRKEEERSVVGTSRETVASYFERWCLTEHKRSQKVTNQHNRSQVQKYADDHGDKVMAEVRPVDAQRWAAENPWRAPQVRAMFSDAVRDGVLDSNPFRSLKLPREIHEGRRDIIVLTEEELGLLVQTAREEHGDYGVVYGAMITVAAYTGMRPAEMYGLRWSDIDWERDELHIRRQYRSRTGEMDLPKSGSKRTIVLLPEAAAAFKLVPRRADSEQVWFTRQGKPMSQRVQHYNWDPVRRAFWNKLPPGRRDDIPKDFDWYDLRHRFGTYLAEMGCSPYEIAAMMGHRDGGQLAMSRYIHLAEDRARRGVKDKMRAKLTPGADERRHSTGS